MGLNKLNHITYFLKQQGKMEQIFVLMCKQGNIEAVNRFLFLGNVPNPLTKKELNDSLGV